MKEYCRRFTTWFDRFLFERCDPMTGPTLRMGYAALMIVYVGVWMIDGPRWFSDEGVLASETARRLPDIPQWSLLYFLPSTPLAIQLYLACMLAHGLSMLLGCWSRFQAACLFVWLVSFQHRNQLICDGEDMVFRLFAFYLIFLPMDHAWSLKRWLSGSPPVVATSQSAWAVRLLQVQMTLIYASAAISKLRGASWRDGSALYLVSRVTDYFGRGWIPDNVFETPWSIRLLTWSVPAIEAALPIALWLKPTRRWAILAGLLFHLGIEYSMNLFLFQWIMMLGLLSFARPSQWSIYSRCPGDTRPESGNCPK